MPTDEEKLLAILKQAGTEAISCAAGLPGEQGPPGHVDEFSDKQRATLQRILDTAMPTPEEIARDARINEHNQQIKKKRDEKLARRRERQAKRGR